MSMLEVKSLCSCDRTELENSIEKRTDKMRMLQRETEGVKEVLNTKRLDRVICAKLGGFSIL